MKIARVFIQEYPGRQVGDIHDVFPADQHPGAVLSGYLKEVEVADDFDKEIMVAIIDGDSITFEEDPAKVTAKAMKQKQAEVEALYNEMNEDVYNNMNNVFGTKKSDSATAFFETWKLMASNPEMFSNQNIKADKSAGGVSAGAALDTDEKVVSYAQARIAEANAYAVWRMNRIEQFKAAKDLVLGS